MAEMPHVEQAALKLARDGEALGAGQPCGKALLPIARAALFRRDRPPPGVAGRTGDHASPDRDVAEPVDDDKGTRALAFFIGVETDRRIEGDFTMADLVQAECRGRPLRE